MASPHLDDLADVRSWFQQLAEHVRAVDYAGARRLYSPDVIAFGTFENVVTGRDQVEAAQWRNVWGVTSDFRYREETICGLVSPDRLLAIGIAVFDSTGYAQDGTPYRRPGRTTVVLSRQAIGANWVAEHTHMSLFREVPSSTFGKKETSFGQSPPP